MTVIASILQAIRNAASYPLARKSSSATGGNDVRLTLSAKRAAIGALP